MATSPHSEPVEAVVFDYGGVITARFFDDLGPFEEQMDLPRGSVRRLMFGKSDASGTSDDQDGDGDPVDGPHATTDPEHPIHDFHRLEVGAISLDVYLAGLVRRAPEVIGRELDLNEYWKFTSQLPVLVQMADRPPHPTAAR